MFWLGVAIVGSSAASIAVKSPDLAMSLTEGGHLGLESTGCRPSATLSTPFKGTSVAFFLLPGSS